MTDFTDFDLSGNSDSGITPPNCENYTGPDLWLEVTAPASGDLFVALLEGITTDAAMALYELPCSSPTELICIPNDLCGNTEMPIYTFTGLNAGQNYLIRIWAESGTPVGTFSIYINETPIIIPDFLLIGSASYISDECIMLTPNSTGQVGCIWYPEIIDFTQSFTHSMVMNFGTQDGNGADGICLAYQSVGNNFCGGSGGDIGAGGMANSFIVEFDTWQNTNRNDPALDHTGVCINGNLDHAVAPFPATVLTPSNIEDGQDHTVDFTWNAATQFFEVFFDGNVYISGNYDIINNCFGGSTTAYWGYTSSTGGSTNTQTVCPGVQTFKHGDISTQEITICDNESVFVGGGLQNTSGVYYDQIPLVNGCYELQQTTLIVNETFEKNLGLQYICPGESFEVGGQQFTNPGPYSVTVPSLQNGCDSTINFNLNILNPFANIIDPETLDCDTPFITLFSTGSMPSNNFGVTYFWEGPNGFMSNDMNPIVNDPGEYTLYLEQTINSKTCTSNIALVEVETNGDLPLSDAGPESTLTCNEPQATLDGSGSDPNLNYVWSGPNGYSSPDLISVTQSPGLYTLVVTAENGCTNTSQVFVDDDLTGPENDPLASDSLSCSLLSVSLENNLATPNDTYFWSGPGIDESQENDSLVNIDLPGIYYLELTGENGCTSIDSIEVVQIPGDYEYQLEADTFNCSTLSIHLESNPGGNYDIIAWEGPNGFIDSTSSPIIDQPGTYLFEITDINGCVGMDSIEVLIDSITPSINYSIDSVQCIQNGQIEVSTNDNLSYQWNGPGTFESNEQNISTAIAGHYELTVTAENGCTNLYQIELPSDDDYPVFETSYNNINCKEEIAIISFNAEDNFQNAQWTLPDNSVITQDQFESTLVGEYYFELTGEDGCVVYDTIEVAIDTLSPTINIISDTISCDQPEVNLTVNSENDILNYNWSGPNNFEEISSEILVDEAGVYSLHVEGNNGCLQSKSIEVLAFNDAPQLDIAFNHINCNVQETSMTTTGDPNLDFIWTGPDNFSSNENNITHDLPGIYQLTARNEYGCDTTLAVDVLIDTISPIYDLEIPTLNCHQTTVDVIYLTQDDIVNTTWSTPDNQILNTENLNVSAGGWYSLELVGENGCTSMETFEILEDFTYPLAEANKSNDLNCAVTNTQLTVQTDLVNAFYEWTNSNNEIIETAPSFETIDAGNFVVSVVGDNGCISLDTIEVLIDTIAPFSEINFNDINCYNSTSFLEVLNPNNNYQYEWKNNGITFSNSSSHDLEDNGIFELVTTGVNACQHIIEFEVEIDTTSPLISANTTLINCFNPEASLSVNAETNHGINWYYNNNIINNSSVFESSIPGSYTVEVTNLINGCSSLDNVEILSYEPPSFDFELVQPDCFEPNGSITFTNLEGGMGNYMTSIEGGNNSSENLNYINVIPNNYNLVVTDIDGCTAFAECEIEEVIPVDIISDGEIFVDIGEERFIEVLLNIPEDALDLIVWSGTDILDCNDCLNPQIIGYEDGIVSLFVTDENGCEDILEIDIRFAKEIDVYVPNVFSPHKKDGHNDFFFPFAKAGQIEQINHMYIFDRWGELVFEGLNFAPNEEAFGWNGTLKGEALNPAVFTFIIEYLRVDGEVRQIVGDVSLVD